MTVIVNTTKSKSSTDTNPIALNRIVDAMVVVFVCLENEMYGCV